MSKKLILASSSPRRQQLLQQVHIPFITSAANIDEAQITEKDPIKRVKKLAILKGQDVKKLHPKTTILAADTIVAHHQTIFEKPRNENEARRMIKFLSGKTHEVYTGIWIGRGTQEVVFVDRTEVEFWPLDPKKIDWYVKTKEPYDKAGGYGIQSLGALFVKRIDGDYYNVVGLPLARVVKELEQFNIFPAEYQNLQ